jgi:phospholipid/cholesterol/gamma-HCH transport system substrate-binding protein
MGGKQTFRYTNETVWAVVLLAILLFITAILQTGRLRDWFEPGTTLKVILPEEGLFGLSKGARVEILGTLAGVVEEIVVVPDQQIHALVNLKERMKDFVRRDSQAIIRKEFGVAGAAFLEIASGSSESLDWDYAVIHAVVERAPTESMGELLSDVRTKVMPIIDETQRLLENLSTITSKIAAGEGAIGRLIVEEHMAVEVETLLTQVNSNIGRFSPILEAMQATVENVSTLSGQLAEQSNEVPQLTRDAGKVLASLESVMQDLSRTTPELPTLIRNVNEATTDFPVLLIQTQQVLLELTQLLQQLQSHWLLGGGGTEPVQRVDRISPMEIKP